MENIYFSEAAEQPRAREARFTVRLKSEEQEYTRTKFDVGEDWVPLDTGWLNEASMLCIENLEGRWTQTIPEVAARAAAAERVIEVACCGVPFGSVHPQTSCRFTPAALKDLTIRCRKGTARISYTVYPL